MPPRVAHSDEREGSRLAQDHTHHVESLKMCCGVLAILSRDEANKLLIARDGMRLLCAIMEQHLGRADLLEAACDLLWSLAFNNPLMKEVIGRQGGIPAILKGVKMHPASADFLKSACGALSNMCQNAHNQSLIAAHGGVPCLLQVLHNHRAHTVLVPFVFDALASLIVGNQENARQLSEVGAAATILSLMDEHTPHEELAKSGCHALAILSDNRGEGGKIAAAGGVRVLLPVLHTHPKHVDLHRVGAVVLLRMLQEAPVAPEIARGGGVPLMLMVLREQIDEVETVAAACHILCVSRRAARRARPAAMSYRARRWGAAQRRVIVVHSPPLPLVLPTSARPPSQLLHHARRGGQGAARCRHRGAAPARHRGRLGRRRVGRRRLIGQWRQRRRVGGRQEGRQGRRQGRWRLGRRRR